MRDELIFSLPSGQLGGIDVFTAHLLRGLRGRGLPAHILLTEAGHERENAFPFPSDLPVTTLPIARGASWRTRWKMMIQYLEDHAPCIYIPSYDYAYSCVCPKLSNRVRIVGIIHSDDENAYDYLKRLGPYWNAMVAVSPTIAAHAATIAPALAARTVTIQNGVEIPHEIAPRKWEPGRPLQVVYAGRLAQRQKRVFDIAEIATLVHERGLAVQFTLIGSGPDAIELEQRCAPLVRAGRVRFTGIVPNAQVLEFFARADVVILTSEFEGFPLSLVEAMGFGCVPVVTDIRSGIPELLLNGVNGYCVPVGRIEEFVACLARLQTDPGLCERMACAAYTTVNEGGYTVEYMVRRYIEVFEQVRQQPDSTYRRPYGPLLPPKELYWQAQLPYPIWLLGHRAKQVFSKLCTDGYRK